MSDLPATLTFFGNLQVISKVINKLALPVQDAHQLADPFLPDGHTPLSFSLNDLFQSSVKYISHAILGRSPPRGQPNHPLQKAMMRWRMENRFNDEEEIKEALLGLLPAMVEKSFGEAQAQQKEWVNFVSSKRLVSFYEKFQDLQLWQEQGFNHRGAALKFRCDTGSIFAECAPVRYTKIPAKTVDQQQYVEFMVGEIPEIEFDPMQVILTQNYAHRQFKEWRLLVDNNEFEEQWLEFSLDILQSVYIGALVPEKTTEQLKNHLAKLNPNINVFQARCRPNEFSLEFEKISEHVEEEVATSEE